MTDIGDEYEIRRAIWVLEHHGYIIRKPSEADIPVVLEVEEGQENPWHIGIRADTKINGVPYAIMELFPVEMVLGQDGAKFRENVVPRVLGDKLGYYIAGKLGESIAAQVKTKIEPLVPEKKMSLDEIVSHIAMALGTSKHRIEPKSTMKTTGGSSHD